MNGIPKGLCSFGGVTPHKMGRCREATEGTDPIRGTCKRGRPLMIRQKRALGKRPYRTFLICGRPLVVPTRGDVGIAPYKCKL